ncbi:type IV pilus biogenesis/stability protein PilW [Alishewanella jeotgali]|uniref:Lytic cell-wall binding lipoprotein n=1 Tax=Alishewanella jeotgali KCTC 22429 TaxID=1129374 RepID=H3ZCN5_9ALTE|nr:type IV pilus biogenesis/stability protein PilW [Alishewanella jeotgali]EHR41615.1 lytic cell-wall binding lipoprotein [Alishewanella jeotgali KCTC 22429]
MQKLPVVTALTALFILSGCVSENTIVANDRQVTQRNVDNTEAAKTRISLGLNYLRRGDSTQALFNLERARAMAPNLPEVYNALAFYYQTVGEHAQAENAYKQAIARDANNADAYNNYGAFLCQIGKYDEAERLLLAAIAKPGYIRVAESYENLALCQLEQDRFERAKGYLASSLSHNGTRISALINSASVHYAMGSLAEAKTDLQRIQRLGRVSARSTLLNYLVSEKQGDLSTMKHAEQLLLTLYIDTNEARLLLQQRLLESEFEQLRERYKQHLLADFMPQNAATAARNTTQPVANPQLRIRRKTAEPDALTATAAASPPPATPVAASTVRPTHSTSAIAGSLQNQQHQQSQQVQALAPSTGLPAERQLTPAVTSEPQRSAAEPAVAVTATEPQRSMAEPAVAVTATEPQSNAAGLEVTNAAETATANLSASDNRELSARLPASRQLSYADTSAEAAQQVPVHLVAAGESLHSISLQYNILLPRLLEWNHLTEQSRLRVGQKIYLGPNDAPPEPAAPPVRLAAAQPVDNYFHQVAEGDTMFAISYRYNIRLERFMAWNNLTEESRLSIGQRLYIVDPATINNDPE